MLGLFGILFEFRRAMIGEEAHLGLPYVWALLCPPLSLALFGFTRKQPAKSGDEQMELVKRWKGMKPKEKLGLWVKWRFRTSDPTVVFYPGSTEGAGVVQIPDYPPPPYAPRPSDGGMA